MPGGSEWLIIALVLLVLFGGAKLPGLMKGMGQGIREFRKELRGDEDPELSSRADSSETHRDKEKT